MPKRSRTTLKDIAEKAGVTVATVSLALRNHPRISAATRKRILAIAEELGYTPDPSLSALAAYRATGDGPRDITIAYLEPAEYSTRRAKLPNRQAIFQGAESRARALGYRFEVFHYEEPEKKQQQLARVLVKRGIRHLLLAPRRYQRDRAPLAFPWEHFCTVSTMNPDRKGLLHCSIPDLTQNQFSLLRALSGRCIGSVGLYIGEIYHAWTNESAFATRFALHPGLDDTIRELPPMIGPEGPDPRPFMDWFQAHRPEVVITNIPFVLKWLATHKVRVPEDCGVAFLDTRLTEGHSGIDIQPATIGRHAVDLLHSRSLAHEFGLPEVPIRMAHIGAWVEGSTLGRPRLIV